jgi:hypothetical protein
MSTLPFIAFDVKTEKYSIPEQTKEVLRKMTDDLCVVTIAGMYRSGKSLFMNKCILDNFESKGFQVGNTISACTKGIWMNTRLVQSHGKNILVMDAEGAFSLSANRTHDTRIFVLALLLSSFFIYNSVKTIDNAALQNLSLVTNMSKYVRVDKDSETKTEELREFMPELLWVLRDFSLKLMVDDNKEISPSEYLERALAKQTDDNEPIRETLRTAFQSRSCSTLVCPCTEEEQLQNLDTLPKSAFRSEFIDGMQSIREDIFSRIAPKTVKQKNVNGQMLLELAECYISAMNNNATPVINDTWSLISENQTLALVATLKNKLHGLLDLPLMGVAQFYERAVQIRSDMTRDFKSLAMSQEMYEKFMQEVQLMIDERDTVMRAKMDDFLSLRLAQIELKINDCQDVHALHHMVIQSQEEVLELYGRDTAYIFLEQLFPKTWLLHDRLFASLEEQLKYRNVEISKLHNQMKELEKIKQAKEKALKDVMIEKEEHVLILNKRVKSLQNEITKSVADHSRETKETKEYFEDILDQQKSILDEFHLTREREYAEHATTNNEQQKIIIELNSEITRYKGELADGGRYVEELEREVQEAERAQHSVQKLTAKYEQGQLEMETLRDENNRLVEQSARCEQELTTLKREMEVQLADLQKSTSTMVRDLKHKYTTMVVSEKNTLSKMKMLEDEKQTVLSALDELVQKHDLETQNLKQEIAEQITKYQEDLQQVEKKFDQSSDAYKQKISLLKQEHRKATKEQHDEMLRLSAQFEVQKQQHSADLVKQVKAYHDLETQFACDQVRHTTTKRKLTELEDQPNQKKFKSEYDSAISSNRLLEAKTEWLNQQVIEKREEQAAFRIQVQALESELSSVKRNKDIELLKMQLDYESQLLK